MSTIFEENGKKYTIENGRVVQASAQQEETVELKNNDRVLVGKKLGTIVGTVETVYGKTAAVKLDDGSLVEKLIDDLERAPIEKTAAVTADGFEGEYNDYEAMPSDTVEDIERKRAKARELNLRAKALATNSHNALADQILYDRIITATYVDVNDLTDAWQRASAAEENYLERLPKYELTDVINRGGMSSGGDASWIDSVVSEITPVELDEAELAQRATQVVGSYNREQLEDDSFMKKAVQYALDTVPTNERTKFAGFIGEARTQKLAEPIDNVRTASTVSSKDMDGNDIDLDSVPFEAIFGV